MKLATPTSLAMAAAALVLAGGAAVRAEAPDADAQLRARIAELESKSEHDTERIADLERRLSAMDAGEGNWLTEQRAEEIRALVEDVLADAETRSSMLGGMTAGYDKGAVISSHGGDWLLRANLLLQPRFVLNSQRNSPGDPSV